MGRVKITSEGAEKSFRRTDCVTVLKLCYLLLLHHRFSVPVSVLSYKHTFVAKCSGLIGRSLYSRSENSKISESEKHFQRTKYSN